MYQIKDSRMALVLHALELLIPRRALDTRVRDMRALDTRVRDMRALDTRVRDMRALDTRVRDMIQSGEEP